MTPFTRHSLSTGITLNVGTADIIVLERKPHTLEQRLSPGQLVDQAVFEKGLYQRGATVRQQVPQVLVLKLFHSRYHVARDDIKAVAPMALRHRLILNFEGQADGVPTDAVVANILKTAQEPAAVA